MRPLISVICATYDKTISSSTIRKHGGLPLNSIFLVGRDSSEFGKRRPTIRTASGKFAKSADAKVNYERVTNH